jgi:hypothetical protein
MKQEIKELVKESLSEQEEEEEEVDDVEVDTDALNSDEEDEEGDDEDADADNEEDMDSADMEMPSDDEEPIDLTGKSDEEVLRVFQLMGPNDNVIVTKDDSGNINLKDGEKEYMIVQESDEDHYDEDVMDEVSDYMETMEDDDMDMVEDDMDMVEDDMDMMEDDMEGAEETIYEISLDDFSEEGEEEEFYEEYEGEDGETFYEDDSDPLMESKMKIKAKGKVGNGPKFKYSAKPNMGGGFKEKMKQGPKSVGTGKAKFEYKDGENLNMKMKKVTGKKTETKEASRTLGAGRKFGRRGLPKPKAAPRHLQKESTDVEVTLLREKNEEYRKALNVFRNKLNEVAVFNSNLAYATRLFTEHSTSKQEKINILRRFDSVETLKESKSLYQTIKNELSTDKGKSLNESVERIIESTPATGSATTLIESKTYENPQFMRMKDLMAKIK